MSWVTLHFDKLESHMRISRVTTRTVERKRVVPKVLDTHRKDTIMKRMTSKTIKSKEERTQKRMGTDRNQEYKNKIVT